MLIFTHFVVRYCCANTSLCSILASSEQQQKDGVVHGGITAGNDIMSFLPKCG